MYLHETVTEGVHERAMMRPPFGPGLQQTEVADVVKMEVWASSIGDPGDDHCEIRLYDANGKVTRKKRVEGY